MNKLPADLNNPTLKLTAVSISFLGKQWTGFVMAKPKGNGKCVITWEQACQVCPPLKNNRYTGCTMSWG